MAFLSTGNAHHDVALVNAGIAGHRGPQLHHFALKVSDSLDELAAVKAELESKGIPVHMTLDHHVSQGVYVTDPEGNLIELYVDDAAERWRDDPSAVAHSDPLSL